MITAKIIADSIWNGQRLTTMQLKYPRFIHSEVMTHRVFSRSASSSRAVPVEKTIQQVIDNPAIPIHFGLNQKGMVADKEAPETIQKIALTEWLTARDMAVARAKRLSALGIHKQVVNRILEPFQLIDVVITATEWDNFFELRLASDAQPEIRELAVQMREAMDTSTPKQTSIHLPYVTEAEIETIINGFDGYTKLQEISAARCARVSYKNHDQTDPVVERDYALAQTLWEHKHLSPFEHTARYGSKDTWYANFKGWQSYRNQKGM